MVVSASHVLPDTLNNCCVWLKAASMVTVGHVPTLGCCYSSRKLMRACGWCGWRTHTTVQLTSVHCVVEYTHSVH